VSAIADYLRAVRREHRGEPTELSYRTAVKELLEALRPGVVAQNEPRHRRDCGAPDMGVTDGTGPEALRIGYLECKDIGVSLDDVEESEQLTRYRDNLDNLILTDYLQFRWYVEGDERARATLAHVDRDGKIVAESGGEEQVAELLEAFLARTPEPIRSPRELLGDHAGALRRLHRDAAARSRRARVRRHVRADPRLRPVRGQGHPLLTSAVFAL